MHEIKLTGRDFAALSRVAKRILQRAETQDAPFVAIPIPGQIPFIVKGSMVRTCVSGLKLTKVSFTNKDGIRLAIEGIRNGGKIRSSYTFYGLPRDWGTFWSIRKQINTWAKNRRQRIQLKRMGVIGVRRSKVHKFLQDIERLQRKLTDTRTYKGLGNRLRVRPRNPFIVVRETGGHEYRSWGAERSKRWHDEKPKRKQLAKIVAKYIEQQCQMFGKVKWAGLYRNLEDAGFRVSYRYGQQANWKHGLSEESYLRALPKFVGLMESSPDKLYRWGGMSDAERAQEHIKELRVYAEAMRDAANLRAQITTLQNMVATLQKQGTLV